MISQPWFVQRFGGQQGIALITVLLIVALIAVLASQMTARLQLQMQRSANVSFNQQAYWYAMGAEAFAKRVLLQSFEGDSDVTNLEQMWAQGENTFPVDFGQITGEIIDLQSCFNLNALRASDQNSDKVEKLPARLAFEELLLAIGIEGVDQFQAEYMADALTDWLDANSAISSAGGAEDNDYAAKEFPYLPANNYLASINELRVIEHFSVTAINKLKDYTCVIPNNNLNAININTLAAEKAEILVALLGIPQDEATQILENRQPEGFATIADFLNLPELVKAELTEDQKQQFVVDSEYFKLKANANFNNSYFALNSILKVDNKNNINVISRIIGRE